MKILIDEMDDGWDDKLKELGFDAYSVKKLRSEGYKLRTDYSVINYAKENDMILVTRDTESGQACDENGLPYILLDNNEIKYHELEPVEGMLVIMPTRTLHGSYPQPRGLRQTLNFDFQVSDEN